MNKDVERFMEAIPAKVRPQFDQLHSLILRMYPDAEVVISYGVPTYKAKVGRVALGYRKDGVSLYPYGPHPLVEFKTKYPNIQTSKGSIKFKTTEKIPVAAVKKVIKLAIEPSKP